jgi:hypothetical protein
VASVNDNPEAAAFGVGFTTAALGAAAGYAGYAATRAARAARAARATRAARAARAAREPVVTRAPVVTPRAAAPRTPVVEEEEEEAPFVTINKIERFLEDETTNTPPGITREYIAGKKAAGLEFKAILHGKLTNIPGLGKIRQLLDSDPDEHIPVDSIIKALPFMFKCKSIKQVLMEIHNHGEDA